MTIWAITTYFNPIRYGSRLRNFRFFRDALAAPLIAVELGYDDEFELTSQDADVLVRVTGSDVLWQKERLLNVALRHVPPGVECVAWFDCDVLLDRADWPVAAVDALRTSPVIQLFSELHDLPPATLPKDLVEPCRATGHSIAHLLSSGRRTLADLDPAVVTSRRRQTAWGLAWAARTSLLVRHGFYDALVIGSGDRAMACAAVGRLDNPIAIAKMTMRQKAHYLRWAEPFYSDVQGNIGCIDGRLYHLWHGAFEDRRYRQRHEAFAQYDFNPAVDLVINESGAYEWARHRRDLAAFCRAYFTSRNEDGLASASSETTDANTNRDEQTKYVTVGSF